VKLTGTHALVLLWFMQRGLVYHSAVYPTRYGFYIAM